MKAAAIAAVLAGSAAARAGTSDRPPIMISDGISDALILSSPWVGDDRPNEGLLLLGVTGYAVGAPIVHAAKGDWGRGGLDLGIRGFAIPTGALIGDALCERRPGSHGDILPCFGAAVIGIGVGMLASEIVDWTLIARGPTPPPMMLTFGGHF